MLLTALPVGAAPLVDVVSVTGTWTDATPPVASLSGLGTNGLSWGVPHEDGNGAGQPGYVFVGTAPPVVSGLPLGSPFLLGTFTHQNFPINAAGRRGDHDTTDDRVRLLQGTGPQTAPAADRAAPRGAGRQARRGARPRAAPGGAEA